MSEKCNDIRQGDVLLRPVARWALRWTALSAALWTAR